MRLAQRAVVCTRCGSRDAGGAPSGKRRQVPITQTRAWAGWSPWSCWSSCRSWSSAAACAAPPSRHGRRRRDGQVAGRTGRARAPGDLAGAGLSRLLVGHQSPGIRAGAGAAGPATVPAPDPRGDRRAAADHDLQDVLGSRCASAAAVRGRHRDELGRLGPAIAGDALGRHPGGGPVHPGPRGAAGGSGASWRQLGW